MRTRHIALRSALIAPIAAPLLLFALLAPVTIVQNMVDVLGLFFAISTVVSYSLSWTLGLFAHYLLRKWGRISLLDYLLAAVVIACSISLVTGLAIEPSAGFFFLVFGLFSLPVAALYWWLFYRGYA